MVDQVDPEVVNTALSYRYLIATGGIALALGFASGFRLNVAAILVLSVVFGGAVFFVTLWMSAPLVTGILVAGTAMALLQFGYFLGILVRPHTRLASSSDRVSPQKSNTR